MKLKVICQVCGKIICEVEKDEISQSDIDMYKANSGCDVDDSFSTELDEDDNEIVVRTSNVAVVKTSN